MGNDDPFIVEGPAPFRPVLQVSMGQLVYDSLVMNPSDNVAMIDNVTGNAITYKDILGKSCALAESLIRNQYNKDSMIAICSENNLEFFYPVIATLFVGATLAPINHTYVTWELSHALDIAKPELVFCSKQVLHKFLALRPNIPFVRKIIIIDSDRDLGGIECLSSFVRRNLHGITNLYRFRPAELDLENHVALIMCSSGTTGLPKGVMITQKNLLVRYNLATDPRYIPPAENQTMLGILPFYHAYGLLTTLGVIMVGLKIVIMSKFDENIFLKTLQDYKITSLYAVPPLIIFLAKSPLVEKYDLSHLKNVYSGAAPLSKATEEAIKKRFNLQAVRQGYGLTEATLGVTGHSVDSFKHGSVGTVLPHIKAKVRSTETGKSLGPYQVGELCFKGPLVMKGYYNNEKASKEAFSEDGWLLTGDLGYYDDDYFFYIVDRLKELIKYKGFQVPPAELESILLTHPQIRDAGVVGLPQEEVGEVPFAFIVKDAGCTLSEKEVEDFVAKLVSSPKRLRGGVAFVNAIPKSASGKILRKELKDMLNKIKQKL